MITYFVDQEYLYKNKKIIEDFLNEGKVVVFCGHLFRKWLPGCSLFIPKKINSYKDYLVQSVPGSPLFEGVEVEDMVSAYIVYPDRKVTFYATTSYIADIAPLI